MNFKINTLQATSTFLLFACGFLVFSPLSSLITQEYLGLSFAFPELLFVPFLILWSKKFKNLTFDTSTIWLLWAFLFLLVLSLILRNFRISSILSTSRGYFYLLLAFGFFKGKKEISVDSLLLICLGSVSAWCIVSIMKFIQIVHHTNNDGSITTYGNLITLSLLVTISIIYSKKKYVFLIVLFGLILATTSGIRRPIVVIAISAFLSIIAKINFKVALRSYLIVFIVGAILFFSYPEIKKLLLEKSPILYQRIIVKTEKLISGNLSSSDKYRSVVLNDYFHNINKYILPRGFVSKRTVADNVGIYMDFPIIELSYMLGIIVLLILLLSIFYYIFRHYIYYCIYGSRINIVWAISGIVLVCLLFLEGTFLTYAFITPFTGMILGRIYTLSSRDEQLKLKREI